MMQILDGLPADVAGWVVVMAALGLFTALLALADRRRQARETAKTAVLAPVPEPYSSWRRDGDRAARDVARSHELAAMQARAAQQIDAVEHAYNRMLAQCAALVDLGPMQPREPAQEAAREPATPAQQPLAA